MLKLAVLASWMTPERGRKGKKRWWDDWRPKQQERTGKWGADQIFLHMGFYVPGYFIRKIF